MAEIFPKFTYASFSIVKYDKDIAQIHMCKPRYGKNMVERKKKWLAHLFLYKLKLKLNIRRKLPPHRIESSFPKNQKASLLSPPKCVLKVKSQQVEQGGRFLGINSLLGPCQKQTELQATKESKCCLREL